MKTKLEVEATLAEVGEVKEFASGFKKRTIVLEDRVEKDGKTFSHILAVDLKKDDADRDYKAWRGKKVKVTCYVESRKWEGPRGVQYFTDVTGREVVLVDGAKDVPEPATPPADLGLGSTEVDDMPF